WFVVRNTPGVTSFVGGANIPGVRSEPIPLAENEVKQILRHMGVETPKFRVAFTKGQRVRVTDGPFAEFIGTVDEVNPDRNKVKLLVSIFGRKTPPAADLLRKAAGIDKGAQTTKKEVVGRVSRDQVRQIAEVKMADLNANSIEAAMLQIEGTARSMGIDVK